MATNCLKYGITVNNVSVAPTHMDRKRNQNADVHGKHGTASL